MKISLHYWLALLLLPAFSGCYPEGAEYTDELDLVYTNYASDFQFSSKHTYAMPDSVIKITGENFEDPDGDKEPDFMSPTYAVPLVEQIEKNMTAAGWQRVDKNANPDVVLLLSTMTTTNIYFYYDWWYWYWWYPGWYPGWGWWYPGYYPPVNVSGYRSGSVFVQMVDKTLSPSVDHVPVVWSCIFNGLAEGSTASIVTRIQNAMDKAFLQSPYLKH